MAALRCGGLGDSWAGGLLSRSQINAGTLSFTDRADISSRHAFLAQGHYFIPDVAKCPQRARRLGFLIISSSSLSPAAIISGNVCGVKTEQLKRSFALGCSEFLFLSLAGLLHHVHPSPGYSQPHQLFLRQQHGANRKSGHVHPRRLRLPAGGRSSLSPA